MKKMTMVMTMTFESNEDMEEFEDFKEAVKNGDITISIPEIDMLDENGKSLAGEMDFSDAVATVIGGL